MKVQVHLDEAASTADEKKQELTKIRDEIFEMVTKVAYEEGKELSPSGVEERWLGIQDELNAKRKRYARLSAWCYVRPSDQKEGSGLSPGMKADFVTTEVPRLLFVACMSKDKEAARAVSKRMMHVLELDAEMAVAINEALYEYLNHGRSLQWQSHDLCAKIEDKEQREARQLEFERHFKERLGELGDLEALIKAGKDLRAKHDVYIRDEYYIRNDRLSGFNREIWSELRSVSDLVAYKATRTAGSLDRLLEAYRQFLAEIEENVAFIVKMSKSP